MLMTSVLEELWKCTRQRGAVLVLYRSTLLSVDRVGGVGCKGSQGWCDCQVKLKGWRKKTLPLVGEI